MRKHNNVCVKNNHKEPWKKTWKCFGREKNKLSLSYTTDVSVPWPDSLLWKKTDQKKTVYTAKHMFLT